MDSRRVDDVLKFVLAAAGREDPGNREVGPIHLVKYVYLADMAYAEKQRGETFTGAPWRFHHFGPWSTEVFQRIDAVVRMVGAVERRISSAKLEDDFSRWSLSDDELFDQLENQLPHEITRALRKAVHEFGDDTTSLLHYVYRTPPMLAAAPGEPLGFDLPSPEEEEDSVETEPMSIEPSVREAKPMEPLSKKTKERRKAAIKSLRERIEARLAEKRAERQKAVSFTPPRYDEVFEEGVRWLESLAGEPPEPQEGELTFSEDIWKSPARTASDVS
jgi:hypothetical protein